jgi:uncharacterized protein YbaP (TraB family)
MSHRIRFDRLSNGQAIGSIEVTIKQFITLSEEKLTKAMANASDVCLEDDEVEITPESIILSTVSGYDLIIFNTIGRELRIELMARSSHRLESSSGNRIALPLTS